MEAKCPKCGAAMPFVAELVGREVFCLGCGSHFVIHGSPTITASAADSPSVQRQMLVRIDQPPNPHNDPTNPGSSPD
jgi:hypothetical protein